VPSISSEAVNFHLDIEEPDPDLPYEPATGAEPVNTVQDEGIRDSQGWANHARRLGGLLLVTLTASLAPAVSAFAASDHEAPHRHTHHHKKHHRSHSKNITFDSTGSFDSTGVSPPNISEQPYPSQAPGLSVPALYAYADANATWGISTPPCNGNVTYQSEPNNFDTSQSWIMESTWHDLYTFPNGQTYDAVNTEGPEFNPRNFFGCTIDYNNQLQPNTSTSDMARNWTYFCTAVGHEWQHFLNEYSHETPIDHGQAVEPTNSISYPSWTGENTPAACITNAPPGVTKIILTSEDPSSKTWLVEPPPGGIDETVTTSPAGASLVFGS
jgi:hypothetical protein